MRISAGILVCIVILVSLTGVCSIPIALAATAGDDTATTNEDTAVTISVLGNDTGVGLKLASAGAAAHGTVVVLDPVAGTVRYTPAANWNGTDSFTYTITEGSTLYSSATGHYYEFVSAPGGTWIQARDGAAGRTLYGLHGYLVTITSAEEQTFVQTKLLGKGWMGAGDAVVEGQWCWMTGPEAGTALSYTHWAAAEPNDSGGNEDYAHFYADGLWNDFNENNSSTDGYVVEYGGMAGDTPTPPPTATVTVVVTPVNDSPVAVPDTFTTAEDTALVVAAPGLLVNDTDIDGPSLQAIFGSGPSHGSVSLSPDGSFRYTPTHNYSGSDSFRYSVWDGARQSPTVAVSLTITPVNDPPAGITMYGGSVSESAPPGTQVGWFTTQDPETTTGFTYTLSGEGADVLELFNVNYVRTKAGLDFETKSSYMLHVRTTDSGGLSYEQDFVVTVTNVNEAPVSANDSYAPTEDVLMAVPAPGLLANDIDVDGDALTARLLTGPGHGAVVLQADGSFTYVPAADYWGLDTFTYEAWDGSLDSPATTVTLAVTPVNDAPSFAKGADQTVLEDCGTQTISGWATVISAGPANEMGQTVDFTVTSDNNGLFSSQPTISSSGVLTWTPAADMNGTATVTVCIHDDGGTVNGGVNTSIVQTFTIIVTAVNDAPSFTKGADQTVLEDCGPQTVASWATAIDAGPADESIQVLHFAVANDNTALFSVQPAIDPSGALSYAPADDMNGTATVTVCIHDDGGMANGGVNMSVSQTFKITVGTVNDAPHFIMGVDQVVLEDCGLQTIPGWATSMSTGPANEAGQTFDFIVTNDCNALFATQPAIAANGALAYVPAADMNGTTVVTVRLHDNGGIADGGVDISAPETFTITVMAANDAPVNTALPTISGISHAGQQLITTTGAWNDSTDLVPGSLVYAFQWQRSADGGATFVDIPGATAPEYRVVPADNLLLVRSRVTCTDDSEGLPLYQSVSVVSAPVGVVNNAPAITEGVGVLVTCDEDESPTVFGLTLHATDADGIDTLLWHITVPPAYGTLTLPVDRSGPAIVPAYHPAPDWNGTDSFVLRVEDGLTGFGEIVVRIIVNPRNDAPVNTVLPGIDGGIFVNHEVRAVVGSWNDMVDRVPGNLTYTYQWLRASDAAGTGLTLVPGATAPSYVVSPLDEGMYLAVRITCMDKGEGLPGSMTASVNSGFGLARYLDIAPPTIELPDFSVWPGVAGWSGAMMQTFTVSSSPFPLQFTLDDNRGPVKWTIRVNGVIVIDPVRSGVITCPVPLSEGRNNIEISASDASDNTTSVKLVIYLDTTGPVLTVEPAVPTSVTTSRLTIAGSVVDVTSGLKRITINGTAMTLYLDGSFRETLTLTRGINTIVIEAEDKAGHTASATCTVTYAPTVQPLPAATVITLTIGKTTMSVGGMAVALDTAPVIKENRTMLPIRAIAEAIDASVAWDPVTRKVTITRGATRLELWIGKSVAKLNGTSVPIDAANSKIVPCITSGRTMLPIRFIAEALGLDVNWSASTNVVTLTLGS